MTPVIKHLQLASEKKGTPKIYTHSLRSIVFFFFCSSEQALKDKYSNVLLLIIFFLYFDNLENFVINKLSLKFTRFSTKVSNPTISPALPCYGHANQIHFNIFLLHLAHSFWNKTHFYLFLIQIFRITLSLSRSLIIANLVCGIFSNCMQLKKLVFCMLNWFVYVFFSLLFTYFACVSILYIRVACVTHLCINNHCFITMLRFPYVFLALIIIFRFLFFSYFALFSWIASLTCCCCCCYSYCFKISFLGDVVCR